MIKPRRNFFVFHFFAQYIRQLIRRHFHEVLISPLKIADDRSVLLLANHFSWWDGFLLWYMNGQVINRTFYVMVLEDTLKKQGFMRHFGGFSIGKTRTHIRESTEFAAALLREPGNLVLIFPQGKIHSNFVPHIRFKRGVETVIRAAGSGFHVVFASLFVENLQYKKPVVRITLEQHGPGHFSSGQELEAAFNVHHASARHKQEHYEA